MSNFKWLITNTLLRHGNEAKNRRLLLFYLFISRIAPDSSKFDSVNSTPGSSMNFHLVDIFMYSRISSNNLINISYSKTQNLLVIFFPSEMLVLKIGYDTSLSLNNTQLLNPTRFQTYR